MSAKMNKTHLALPAPRAIAPLLLGPLLLGLGGCVVSPPPGPTFVSLPPAGKNLNTFTSEDGYCRQVAMSRSGYAGNQVAGSTATGAVAGTAIGAGAGALIGAAAGRPGLGAAAGAGTGLVAGSAIGASNGASTQYQVQANYDGAYAQCMASYGNQVPPPDQIPVPVAGYASYGYPVPYYYGYGAAWDWGPGWGWGWGPGWGWGGWYGGGWYGRGWYGRGWGGGWRGGGGWHGGGGGWHGGGHR